MIEAPTGWIITAPVANVGEETLRQWLQASLSWQHIYSVTRSWLYDWGSTLICVTGVWLFLLWTIILSGFTHSQLLALSSTCEMAINWTLVTLLFRTCRQKQLSKRLRFFWLFLAVGFTCAGVADLIWIYYELTWNAMPLTSPADILYLAGYCFIGLAVLAHPPAPQSHLPRVRLWLDASTVFVGALMVDWYFVLYPIYAKFHGNPWDAGIALLYPALDTALVGAVVIIFLRQPKQYSRQPFQMLLIGSVLMLVSDLAFSVQLLHDNQAISSWVYGAAYTSKWLVALSAQLQFKQATQTESRSIPARAQDKELPYGVLPYLAIIAGYVILIFGIMMHDLNVIEGLIIGTVLLTVLVSARQILVLRENAKLLRASTMLTEELKRSEARFRSLVQNTSDIITVLAEDGAILYESPAVDVILGYRLDTRLKSNFRSYIHPDDVEKLQKSRSIFLQATGSVRGLEVRMRHANGTWLWVEVHLTNLLTDPNVSGIVANYRDISERKRFEEQLCHLAYHDPLTNVANRTLFQQQLVQTFAAVESTGNGIAVFMLDLDSFKQINDTYGHSIGDQLLMAVGQRIRHCVRKDDLVARLGGDEFAVLLRNIGTPTDAIKVAQRILHTFAEPVFVENKKLWTRGSLGIALYTSDIATPDELLRCADRAMYQAKNRGKGCYTLWSASGS